MLFVLALVPACATDTYDEGEFGCPVREPVLLFDNFMPCDGVTCPIALGGKLHVYIEAPGWASTYAVTDGAITHEAVADTNDHSVYLRATELGTGRFELHASCVEEEEVFHKYAIDTLPVADVRLRALDEVFVNNPASSHVEYSTARIGWHTSHPRIYVELAPPGAGVTAPPYVVDASMRLGPGTDPSVEYFHQSALIATAPGDLNIELEADSFERRAFQVHVFDHVDRIEARVEQAPARVGDVGSVCFYAFAEDYELAVAHYKYQFGGANIDRHDKLRRDNCRTFTALAEGTASVSMTIEGATKSVSFTIAR